MYVLPDKIRSDLLVEGKQGRKLQNSVSIDKVGMVDIPNLLSHPFRLLRAAPPKNRASSSDPRASSLYCYILHRDKR